MAKPSTTNQQKKLRKFIKRRHPEYERMLPHWEFLCATYEGGREWFRPNLFRYIKEGDQEYCDRLGRAYRFNHSREVVDLVNKYIFKMAIDRSEDAPDSVKKFWKQATLNGMSMRDFMQEVSRKTSIFGRIWVVIDNDAPSDTLTKADEKDVNTYAYIVDPTSMLDMSYDDREQLVWALVHEQERDDSDPLNSSGEIIDRFRLWEREQYTIFKIVPKNGKKPAIRISADAGGQAVKDLADRARAGELGELGTVTVEEYEDYNIIAEPPQAHGFGEVPIIPCDHLINRALYWSPSLISDIAYLDRAVANYLSNLDAIIQDQTYSQLVIPAQGIIPGEDAHDKLIEMGTKRVFTYNGEGGGAPSFISPDVKQAELILSVIAKIINEIYHTAGLAGERTKDDNSQGVDNSSGVAKAYDFERVNSMLAAKSDSLELIEHRIATFVAKWNGETLPVPEDVNGDPLRIVSYPDNFDVRSLYDEFEIAARLSLIEAPDTVRRHQMTMMVNKLFPQLKKDLLDKIKKEIEDWPPEPVVPDPVTGKQSFNQDGKLSQSKNETVMSDAANNSLANKLVNS